MCWGAFDNPQKVVAQAGADAAQAAASLPTMDLPGFGDFASRTREAGLGTTVKPKTMGTLVIDPTRQSR